MDRSAVAEPSTLLEREREVERVHTTLKAVGRRAGEALIIAPSNAIHTFFMRFAIDVAFVARDGRVLKVRARMKPWHLSAAFRAFSVVEVPAGVFGSSATERGDTLALEGS